MPLQLIEVQLHLNGDALGTVALEDSEPKASFEAYVVTFRLDNMRPN